MTTTGKVTTKRRHFAVWVLDQVPILKSTHTNAKDACKASEKLLDKGFKEIHLINTTPEA